MLGDAVIFIAVLSCHLEQTDGMRFPEFFALLA